MQKVEGSSPFSRFKSPANAGFFVGVPPGDATVVHAERRGFEPRQPRRAYPCLVAFQDLGRRDRDQTAGLLSPFRIRSGNSSRKGLAATRRAGHDDPAGDLEDLGRTLALFLSDGDGWSPTSSPETASTVRARGRRPGNRVPPDCPTPRDLRQRAAHSRWRFCSCRALAGILQTHRSVETRDPRGAGRWLVAVRVLVARGNRGRSDLAATRREVPRSAVDPGNR